MKFRQRKGLVKASETFQTNGMNDALRNSLWNALYTTLFSKTTFLHRNRAGDQPTIEWFSRELWDEYYKQPIDDRPEHPHSILDHIRERFFSSEWGEVYEFVEFVAQLFHKYKDLELAINYALEREHAGYRLVNGVVTDITHPEEIATLDEALKDDTYSGVTKHLQTALEHFSRRDNPDYRNSIKESISAVEAMVQIIAQKPNASLGDAFKTLESKKKLHTALRKGFDNLYGYTSDGDGIRHAMIDEPDLTAADARYFLVSCSAFVNYLKTLL
jgi:hypothetical protein